MKIKDYFTPKSFIYTGKTKPAKTNITHYHYNKDDLKITDSFEPIDGFKSYIEVVGLSDVDAIKKIKTHYTLEDIVLEDILNVSQRTKIEAHQDYLFMVFKTYALKQSTMHTHYMSLLLYEDTLIAFYEEAPYYHETVHEVLKNYHETRTKGSDFLLFQLLDLMTDDMLVTYEVIETKAELFEEEMLESKAMDQEAFYLIRKDLLKLKNSVSPMLEHINRLIEKQSAFIQAGTYVYFNDLIDHLKRLDHNLNLAREMMRHLLDLHINNQSNKMNRIMTTLTLFSAIFIPLSFLTGFFGMNFVHFEVLEYEHSLTIFIMLCLGLAGLMLLLFKKMKWF